MDKKQVVILRGVAKFNIHKKPIKFEKVENSICRHPDPLVVSDEVQKRLKKIKEWK